MLFQGVYFVKKMMWTQVSRLGIQTWTGMKGPYFREWKGDTHLDRVQSCADLRPNGMNTENLALRICTNDEGPCPLRACRSVQNISTGRDRNLNLAETDGGLQMGSHDAHHMVTGSSNHRTIFKNAPLRGWISEHSSTHVTLRFEFKPNLHF